MSKPTQMSSDSTKVKPVVSSATLRMLRRPISLSSLIRQDQGRADERQEGDRGKNWPVGHQKELPSIIQVTSAATPISIANA